MQAFNLFLDESGQFKDLTSSRPFGSLVGGYFCLDSEQKEESAWELISRVYQKHDVELPEFEYHAMNIKPREKRPPVLRDVMRGVSESGGQLVVTRNRSKYFIRNATETYLHLTAECVVCVLQKLLRKHSPPFSLEVIIAYRGGEKPDTYKSYIRNHLGWAACLYGLPDLMDMDKRLEIKVMSASRNFCLQVADHICFGIGTEVAMVGEPDFLHELNPYLLDEVIIENGEILSLRRSLHEERYADALLEAISIVAQESSPLADEALRAMEQEVIPRLNAFQPLYREYHFKRLFDSLDIRTNLLWQLSIGREIFDVMEEHLIGPLRNTFREEERWIDFRLQQLRFRLANHQGETTKAQLYLKKALTLAPQVLYRWEMTPIWFNLKLSEAVFLVDVCNFEGAIEILNELETIVRPMVEHFSGQLPAPLCKADLLGRIYGTRLQAYIFAGHREEEYFSLAREDSERAIQAFTNPQDIDRQYLYRCHLETDAGKLLEALRFLGRAMHIPEAETDTLDVEACVDAIGAALCEAGQSPFHLRHFCRIWADAVQRDPRGRIARALAEAWWRWVESKITPSDAYEHPWEVVDWKSGIAMMRTGRREMGRKRLERTVLGCLKRTVRPPLYTIGLACLADWAALEYGSSQFEGLLERLQRIITEMLEDNTGQFPETMKDHFKPWREILGGSPTSEDLSRLSWDVAY